MAETLRRRVHLTRGGGQAELRLLSRVVSAVACRGMRRGKTFVGRVSRSVAALPTRKAGLLSISLSSSLDTGPPPLPCRGTAVRIFFFIVVGNRHACL